ncbi:Peroxisomal membrane protein PEX13 [Nakaseomyces bracarensis]|uniref:Peroxisomal membrane protein PEX13 n=1 Tax=Nakaseomyces bracarensis TaxID=273131 RepID=A0ABR4NN69_9SACH
MTVAETRPKPWETGQNIANGAEFDSDANTLMARPINGNGNGNGNGSGSADEQLNREESEPPEVVPRPPGLTNSGNTYGSDMYRNNAGYGYDGGMYSGGMYGNSGGMYGNSGGMFGSMYGGALNRYGGGMYGGSFGNYGSYYGNGMYGGGYGENNMNGLEQISESTRATFQLIESLIGAVTGFAQMLESTYMATHNSFFTMISVAEQFNYLKEVLGSAFGIFALMKFLKRVLYYITQGKMGTPPSKRINSSSKGTAGASPMIEEFSRFSITGDNKKPTRRITWKPLVFFLAAVFGFPYLLNKFIAKLQEVQRKNGVAIDGSNNGPIDPSKLEFARALYNFTPENPQVEITLKKGDLVAILSKTDPLGRSSDWWKVRNREGQSGYAPYNYLEIIKRTKKAKKSPDEEVSTN